MSLGAKSRGRRRPQVDAGGHSPPRAFAPGALPFCGRNAFPSVGRRTKKKPRYRGFFHCGMGGGGYARPACFITSAAYSSPPFRPASRRGGKEVFSPFKSG